ncbi:uncharacterized protein L3040_008156 [Drepanopeziza brunnea f. sp. 'multigermtubi']|uniref:uncharacterized protein n=1 Tax=Drepanopeziza brunnea f. sp. 'multigermtubi' TaxID=698441 RepID=UPI0023903FE6|nr:hypothetical protein L3040_008156 [Drepanopeziza brunnea f. sp. 'multigermtubi']
MAYRYRPAGKRALPWVKGWKPGQEFSIGATLRPTSTESLQALLWKYRSTQPAVLPPMRPWTSIPLFSSIPTKCLEQMREQLFAVTASSGGPITLNSRAPFQRKVEQQQQEQKQKHVVGFALEPGQLGGIRRWLMSHLEMLEMQRFRGLEFQTGKQVRFKRRNFPPTVMVGQYDDEEQARRVLADVQREYPEGFGAVEISGLNIHLAVGPLQAKDPDYKFEYDEFPFPGDTSLDMGLLSK